MNEVVFSRPLRGLLAIRKRYEVQTEDVHNEAQGTTRKLSRSDRHGGTKRSVSTKMSRHQYEIESTFDKAQERENVRVDNSMLLCKSMPSHSITISFPDGGWKPDNFTKTSE